VSDAASLARRAKAVALALGFDAVGVTEAAPPEPARRRFRDWLARGLAGEMDYLERSAPKRLDPSLALPGARSALCVGLVYATGAAESAPRAVARYAGGDDYHGVVIERLRSLGAALEALAGRAVRWRPYVDTGPVLERALAARAGLGWLGKNTCLIHPELGSHLVLGVLLCDLELEPDAPEPDHCGECRACLDACPTAAFVEAGCLDATRCIAYTTIEASGPIDAALRSAQGERVFGCDTCQDVCPWNGAGRRALRAPADPLGLRARLAPRDEWARPALGWILDLDEEAWRAATRHTALRRARWRSLLRNALVAAGNSGDASLRPQLERFARGADRLLAEHARWALARLG
jgi:epoxyqueuosine reductase